jgi:ADP-heptose:LPS heptosyltransferase
MPDHNFSPYLLYYYGKIILSIFITKKFKKIAHNVPAVSDVFFAPDKENTKHFTGAKKCGGEKPHKGR